MAQTASRRLWKEIVIAVLALALLALLVWLFLRPAEPARRLIFGDLGNRSTPSNTVVGRPAEPAPEPPGNPILNGGQSFTNIPQTNAALLGQGGVPPDAGSNVPGTVLSNNQSIQSGGSSASVSPSNEIPLTPSNSVALPAPRSPPLPVRSSPPRGPHGTWAPDADWPPDAANKDTTASLLAAAKAANMSRVNPIPARTADLLGRDTEPWRVFDAETGSNVVFILDNSMSMLTNGKSSSARQEVARTLQTMNAGQTFYVLFFHTGGYEGMPSLAPLLASSENVRAMTNWLFSVGHRTGADPTKAMQRALGLVPAPDTVWLLSGSPLPDQVMDNIRAANAVVNAHINTIGFYSRDGEQALRRIADENRGAYRFVPPPNPSPP